MERPKRMRTSAPAALGALLILAAGGLRGRLSYRLYCRSCHGEDGRGEGPMAELLKVSPTDLTALAKRNGGEFPAEKTYRAIDGRQEVRGHGPRGMPVWGIGLQDLGRDHDQEAETRARILDLVTYVEHLQAPRSRPDG